MPIHPTRILWPTDFSPLSLKAAGYAEAFRKGFEAELHVIYVCPVLAWSDSSLCLMSGGDMHVSTVDLATPARAQLATLVQQHFSQPAQVRTAVETGTAWYEICRYARQHQIDLIVIATHGVTGLRHLMMGSTAERVVQHAAAPVLTIKSIERDFLKPPSVKSSQSRRSRNRRRQRTRS